MWFRILLLAVALIAISFVLERLLPKTGRGRRISSYRYLAWDIAPLLGFFGIVLLGLSLVEGLHQLVMCVWLGGSIAGLVAGVVLWIALMQTLRAPPPARREPVL